MNKYGNPSWTREDLAWAIAKNHGLPIDKAKDILETLIKSLCDAFSRQEDVSLRRFGTFYCDEYLEHTGMDFKTKKRVTVPGYRLVRFKMSKMLKDRLNRDI